MTSLIIFKRVDLSPIDFTKKDNGSDLTTGGDSMFKCLLIKGLDAAKNVEGNHFFVRRLIFKSEKMFFYLTTKVEKKLGKEKLFSILESPNGAGDTVFRIASILSEKISGWILERNMDVAFVNSYWFTPQFYFKSHVEKMLEKGINPFVVRNDERSEYLRPIFRNINRNKKKREKFLKPFLSGKITEEKTEVYFSFDDSNCSQKCGKVCGDKMRRFKLYTGKRIFHQEKRGGEGTVSFGSWHNVPAAFKLVELGKLEEVETVLDAMSMTKKTTTEFDTAYNLSHPNIVKVLHLFRYQESEKMNDVRKCIKNVTVIVMEKHEKNIRELISEERIHFPDLLQDVLGLVEN